MNHDNKTYLQENLEAMSTQQLEILLHKETAKENMNVDTVLEVLTILEHREDRLPAQTNINVEKAWQEFKTYYMHPHKKVVKREKESVKMHTPKSWLIKIAATAAIICIIIFAAPKAMGSENIFTLFGQWTKSVFEFFNTTHQTNNPDEYIFKTDNPGLQQLYDAVVAQGISQPIVPMWIPDGYELDELKTINTPTGRKICASFVNINHYISITIGIYDFGNGLQFSKDDTEVSVYEISDIKHYIMNNEDNCFAAWATDNIEGSISLDQSEEILRKILRSIY